MFKVFGELLAFSKLLKARSVIRKALVVAGC